MDSLNENSDKIEKYITRLRQIMTDKHNLAKSLLEANEDYFHNNVSLSNMDDDNVSDLSAYTTSSTTILTSSSASSTVASARPNTVYKKKKKKQKHKNKLRAGTEHEDAELKKYILNSLDFASISGTSLVKVGMLCELLVILDHADDAILLQKACDKYCHQHEDASHEVSKMDISAIQDISNVPPKENSNTSLPLTAWKWALLREE